jgi:hypothetical protein
VSTRRLLGAWRAAPRAAPPELRVAADELGLRASSLEARPNPAVELSEAVRQALGR